MRRLEGSGAVRPIWWSLGVKGLKYGNYGKENYETATGIIQRSTMTCIIKLGFFALFKTGNMLT
jgi:hypothetical protein